MASTVLGRVLTDSCALPVGAQDDDGAIAFSEASEKQASFVRIFPKQTRARTPLAAVDIASGSNHILILASNGKVE